MRRKIWTVVATATAVVVTSVGASAIAEADTAQRHIHHRTVYKAVSVPDQPSYGLDGVGLYMHEMEAWYAWATADLTAKAEARAAAEAAKAKAAAAKRVVPRSAPSSVPRGGPCYSSKPAGFPDYIINRESGGDPNAVNSHGGAAGCAQIMPEHFRSGGGCAGMSYNECWSYLWADGRGASNWACTRESGCAR